MSTWWSDCALPTVDTMGGADLLPVYSQANGAKRNISATNMRTFMQEGVTVANGLLGLSSVYELFSTTSANYGTVGTTNVPLNVGLTSRTLPAGRTSIAVSPTTGEFVLQRDCQGVEFNVCLQAAAAAAGAYRWQVIAQVEGTTTFVSPYVGYSTLSTAYTSQISSSGVLCNPNNPNNIIKAGEKIRFYMNISTAIVGLSLSQQIISVRTMDGV